MINEIFFGECDDKSLNCFYVEIYSALGIYILQQFRSKEDLVNIFTLHSVENEISVPNFLNELLCTRCFKDITDDIHHVIFKVFNTMQNKMACLSICNVAVMFRNQLFINNLLQYIV